MAILKLDSPTIQKFHFPTFSDISSPKWRWLTPSHRYHISSFYHQPHRQENLLFHPFHRVITFLTPFVKFRLFYWWVTPWRARGDSAHYSQHPIFQWRMTSIESCREEIVSVSFSFLTSAQIEIDLGFQWLGSPFGIG